MNKVKGFNVERDYTNSYAIKKGDKLIGRLSMGDTDVQLELKIAESPYWVTLEHIPLKAFLGKYVDAINEAWKLNDTKEYLRNTITFYKEEYLKPQSNSADYYDDMLRQTEEANTEEELETLCLIVDGWLE